jgi:hypothetical protein
MMRNVCLVDGEWTLFRPEVTSQMPPSYDLNLMDSGESANMLLACLPSCTQIAHTGLVHLHAWAKYGALDPDTSFDDFPGWKPSVRRTVQHATFALLAIKRRRLCTPVGAVSHQISCCRSFH